VGGACTGVGACGAGVVECNGAGGTRCSTMPGGSADGSSAEVCDGSDNDCDTLTDEGFNVGRACDGVGACGAGLVECAGPAATRCSTDAGGSQDQSRPETCNGLDDDCDGTADDGIGLGGGCDGTGECGPGVRECDGLGGVRCSTEPGGSADQSRAETCNARDDDCNGVADNGFNLGAACDGVGECGAGVRECDGSGGARCSTDAGGSADQSRAETCNGRDDDCDGAPDDGFNLGGSCDGVGDCGLGVRECNLAGGVRCSTDPGGTADGSRPEQCNGRDDDCNGAADNGFGIGGACDGIGRCGAGVVECATAATTRCSTDPGGSADESRAETCNALDDDCDRLTDEDFGVGGACDGRGECGAGVRECETALTTRCSTDPGGSQDQSVLESCDGLDNDCNGLADNGFGIGTACTAPGVCGAGVRECATAATTRCSTGPGGSQDRSVPERCDALDNDCDVSVDEDYRVGQSCDGTGACGTGVYECVDAATSACSTNPGRSQDQSVTETCNGIDDDCNGTVDNGFGIGGVCDGVGACGAGNRECAGPLATRCSTDRGGSRDESRVEQCNGVDDDCDGALDNGFGVGGACDGVGACGAGVVECRNTTSTRCSTDVGGSASQVVPEVCDNLDNDCDGTVDDGVCVCDSRDPDADGFSECAGDCDVGDGQVFPGAIERCNGRDDDCDALTDEGYDNDGDTYTTCPGQDPAVVDCNDTNPAVHPGASEVCGNNVDDDCNGYVDETCACSPTDPDGDGFSQCEGDCAPADANVNPGEAEVCEGVDTDCNQNTVLNCDVGDTCNWPGTPVPDDCLDERICVQDVQTLDWECATYCNGAFTGGIGDGCQPGQTCSLDLLYSANIHLCTVPDRTPGTRAVGTNCTNDSQCRSLSCYNAGGGSRYCIGVCNSNHPPYCPESMACYIVANPAQPPNLPPIWSALCINNTGGDTGDPCTATGNECRNGPDACVNNRCAEPCCSDLDCPGGYHCSVDGNDQYVGTFTATNEDAVTTVPVCLPNAGGTGTLRAGAQCDANNDCLSRFCERDSLAGRGGTGKCVELCCSDATCLNGTTCEAVWVVQPDGELANSRVCVHEPAPDRLRMRP
jgi:hypothetical protein